MNTAMAVNLIPKARQAKAERRRRLAWWGGAWAVYAIVLGLGVGMMFLRLGSHANLTDELTKENQQHTELQSEQHAVTAKLKQVSWNIASSRGLLEQPDWSELLSVLSDLRQGDVALAAVGLQLVPEQPPAKLAPAGKETDGKKAAPVVRKTKWNLQMTGFGKTPESVSQFVLRLEGTGLFDRVNLLKTDREPFGAGEATSFSISCPLKGYGRSTQ